MHGVDISCALRLRGHLRPSAPTGSDDSLVLAPVLGFVELFVENRELCEISPEVRHLIRFREIDGFHVVLDRHLTSSERGAYCTHSVICSCAIVAGPSLRARQGSWDVLH